jgi:hypothetical protein
MSVFRGSGRETSTSSADESVLRLMGAHCMFSWKEFVTVPALVFSWGWFSSERMAYIMAQNTCINSSGIDAVLYSVCLSKRSGKDSDI